MAHDVCPLFPPNQSLKSLSTNRLDAMINDPIGNSMQFAETANRGIDLFRL
jgi:hypothetical protein